MKRGCLFLLIVLGASFAGYCYLFLGTEFEHRYWISGLFALAVTGLFGNIYGIFSAIGNSRATGRARVDWRDGDFIGVSGRVRSASPIKAPFSGTDAVIVEYNVRRVVRSNDSTRNVDDFTGFMQTPAEIESNQGSIRLVGFPLLAQIKSCAVDSPEAVERAANFLAKANFKPRSNNPMAALKELNAVLTDDDGLVQADYCANNVLDLLDGSDDELDESDEELDNSSKKSTVADINSDSPEVLARRVEQFRHLIGDSDYTLNETIIPNGAEVTAFGTFSRDKNSINVGSGLKNLSHSLQLGTSAAVTSKAIRSAVIGTIFWAILLAGANYYVLGLIGIDLKQYLSAITF